MENKNIDKIIMKWVPLIIGILSIILVLNSCTIYKQPAMKITSVLAVTAEGDTLKLPIDVIRPIYNYNTYPRSYVPYNNTFYYSPHRYQPIYGGGNYSINHGKPGNNNNNNSNSNSSNIVIRPGSSSVNPPPPPNPAVNNPRKNN